MNLADKISSYNLFNYLFSGILFVVFAEKFTKYTFIQRDIVLGVFVYYFIGLVISRVGSLILEPLLKACRIVRFAPYKDFVRASKGDAQIAVLSEANNTYRTLCAVVLAVGLVRVYQVIDDKFKFDTYRSMLLVGALLLFIFIFSYRKQTAYITQRIRASDNSE